MTVPLMFLAAVTIVAGFIPFGHFVSSNGEAYTIHLDWGVAGTSIAIAVISIAVATYMYKGEKQPVADALARRFNGLWTAAYHRFYIDEVYQFITHRIIWWTASSISLPGAPMPPATRYAACKADASSNTPSYSCWVRLH